MLRYAGISNQGLWQYYVRLEICRRCLLNTGEINNIACLKLVFDDEFCEIVIRKDGLTHSALSFMPLCQMCQVFYASVI